MTSGTSSVYGYDGIGRLIDLQLKQGTTILNEYGFSYTPAAWLLSTLKA